MLYVDGKLIGTKSGKQVKGTQLPRNGIFIQKGKKFVGK